MLQFICNRVKTLLLMLLGIVKRALCCFRRRRRLSGDPVPLTAVGVVPNAGGVESEVPEFQNWNSWPDGPESVVSENIQANPIQQQIELYRLKAKQSDKVEPEEEPDFFQDMTPRITKQPKIVLKTEMESSRWSDGVSPRLTLDADSIGFPTAELETWEEGSGWEDQTKGGWDTGDALREKRRQERQQRALELQQKKQQQRVTGLGLRIAS